MQSVLVRVSNSNGTGTITAPAYAVGTGTSVSNSNGTGTVTAPAYAVGTGTGTSVTVMVPLPFIRNFCTYCSSICQLYKNCWKIMQNHNIPVLNNHQA